MAAAIAVEHDHAGKHLHHRHQALAIDAGLNLALPLAADREHLAIEVADVLTALIVERVIAAEIDDVAAQGIKLGLALFVHQKEREIFGQQRPLVGRALEVDHVTVVIGVDRVRHYRQAAGANGLLDRAAEHQIGGRLPAQVLGEQLEHEALVHAFGLFPKVLAIAEQPRAFAVFDDLGEDVHVGRKLARLGLVARALIDAEFSKIEVRDPHVDDETVPAICGSGRRFFGSGYLWRLAGLLQGLGAGFTRGFVGGGFSRTIDHFQRMGHGGLL